MIQGSKLPQLHTTWHFTKQTLPAVDKLIASCYTNLPNLIELDDGNRFAGKPSYWMGTWMVSGVFFHLNPLKIRFPTVSSTWIPLVSPKIIVSSPSQDVLRASSPTVRVRRCLRTSRKGFPCPFHDTYNVTRELHLNIHKYTDLEIYKLVFKTTSGTVFPGPPGHLNIQNPTCIQTYT